VSSPPSAPLAPKSSTFTDQVATATSFADIQRYYQPLQVQAAQVSPPSINQLNERQFVFDVATGKLWTLLNGVPKSCQFS
jgi:hypothetical protein